MATQGGPVAVGQAESPLPGPAALALEIEAAMVEAYPEAVLMPSATLRASATLEGYRAIAERRGRAVDLLAMWRVVSGGGYAWVRRPIVVRVIVGQYDAAAVVRSLRRTAFEPPAVAYIGVGVAKVGDQWRTVIAVVGEGDLPTAAMTDAHDVHLPAAQR